MGEYDEEGALTAQQSADAQQVKYIYSYRQEKTKASLKQLVYPDGLKEQFEHDEEGRLLKHTDTKGLSTQYRYNSSGSLEQRIDAESSSNWLPMGSAEAAFKS